LLALSSIALVLPTPFAEYYDLHDTHVLIVSRVAAFFLIFMYAQLLFFQLYTHAHVFEGTSGDDELASLSLAASVTGLCLTTLLVAVFSEYLVGSIEGFTEASGISRTFVGIILLPIVGNAVEHVAAVSVSMKDKMDLAMGIAVGSCTQISLFVVPLTIISGWLMGRDMTLNFPHFEIVLYVLSVFTVSVVISTSKCNWLQGSLLVTTYCLIAVGFWFENVRNFS
jgi:Ca2+:H+ antiporter